ncbi:hypothetical protein RJT34_04138 [Clitoria ternatea]|uniref:Uncharacterized protein n=1 Tax=Clitoria ternatea TaxID=43366 RepID=A0AAN9KNI1_CLITE
MVNNASYGRHGCEMETIMHTELTLIHKEGRRGHTIPSLCLFFILQPIPLSSFRSRYSPATVSGGAPLYP